MDRFCATCGHGHRTMASVWTAPEGTRWYCHENDHSCYSDLNKLPVNWASELLLEE